MARASSLRDADSHELERAAESPISALAMCLRIVRADPCDAAILSALARAAKGYWGYSAAALEEWRELLTISPESIAENETFNALAHEEIVGFYVLEQSGGPWRLEHLWILPDWIGRGVGRALFHHATQRAAELGATCLTIESDPHAESFYLHMGATRTGSVVSQLDGRPRELPVLTYTLRQADLYRLTKSGGNPRACRRQSKTTLPNNYPSS